MNEVYIRGWESRARPCSRDVFPVSRREREARFLIREKASGNRFLTVEWGNGRGQNDILSRRGFIYRGEKSDRTFCAT